MNKDNVLIIGDSDEKTSVLKKYIEQALLKEEHVMLFGSKTLLEREGVMLPHDTIERPKDMTKAKTRLWVIKETKANLTALHKHMLSQLNPAFDNDASGTTAFRVMVGEMDVKTVDMYNGDTLPFFIHSWSEIGVFYDVHLTIALKHGEVLTKDCSLPLRLLFDNTGQKLFLSGTYSFLTEEQQQKIDDLHSGEYYGVTGLGL